MTREARRRPGVEATPAADGYLARVPGTDAITWLNRTGYLVMELCTGVNDETAIARALMDAFDLGDPPVAAVRATIADLVTAGLVESGETRGASTPRIAVAAWAPGPAVDRDVLVGLQSLVAEAQAEGIPVTLTVDRDRSMRGARNRAANALLRGSDATHVLLLDAAPDAIAAVRERSLARLAGSGHDVIGIPVPLGATAWARVREAAAALPAITDDELAHSARGYDVSFESEPGLADGGFAEGRHCGSGALLVGRAALERIAGSGVANRHRGSVLHGAVTIEPSWGFFDPGTSADGIDIDEDLAFCERVRASGGTVMIDVTGGFGTFLDVTARLRGTRP